MTRETEDLMCEHHYMCDRVRLGMVGCPPRCRFRTNGAISKDLVEYFENYKGLPLPYTARILLNRNVAKFEVHFDGKFCA